MVPRMLEGSYMCTAPQVTSNSQITLYVLLTCVPLLVMYIVTFTSVNLTCRQLLCRRDRSGHAHVFSPCVQT